MQVICRLRTRRAGEGSDFSFRSPGPAVPRPENAGAIERPFRTRMYAGTLQGDLRGLSGAGRRHSTRKRCCIRHAHLAERREMKPVGKRVVQVGNCMLATELLTGFSAVTRADKTMSHGVPTVFRLRVPSSSSCRSLRDLPFPPAFGPALSRHACKARLG